MQSFFLSPKSDLQHDGHNHFLTNFLRFEILFLKNGQIFVQKWKIYFQT